jgi:long-chain-fatty-acid--CoA ligase ACSBG
MHFRGFGTGIYTTNSPEACHYCAEKSYADIIVVEDKKQLDKILSIKDRLPMLKAIVQYDGNPEVEGVISVRNRYNAERSKFLFTLLCWPCAALL